MTQENRTLAYGLMVIGGLFLLGTLFPLVLWTGFPFLAMGGMFLYMAHNETPTRMMAVPGMILFGTGLINSFFGLLNHMEGWAYAWMLYPVFLGLAFMYVDETKDGSLSGTGRMFVNLGLLGFAGFAIFFELFIFTSFGTVGNILIAAALIYFGYRLLNGDARMKRKPKRKYHVNVKTEEPESEKAGIYV
jgi:predicted membrane protein